MFNAGPNLTARGQQFVSALTVVLVLVIGSTILDLLLNIYPFRTDDIQWRFSASGLVLSSMPGIFAQLAVLIALGTLLGSRITVRRALGFLFLLAGLSLLLLPFFMLDFMQSRLQVPIERRPNFDLAALKTTAMGGLVALGMGWAAWVGWSATPKPLAGAVREKGDGLVVGR